MFAETVEVDGGVGIEAVGGVAPAEGADDGVAADPDTGGAGDAAPFPVEPTPFDVDPAATAAA